MDTYLQMIALAIVQGLTEFLPVSSSGHLVLAKHFLNFTVVGGLGVELLLHAGTLVAVVWFYRNLIVSTVIGLWRREAQAWRFTGAILLSTLPAVVVGLYFETALESTTESPFFVCACLIFTGLLLLATRLWGRDAGRDVTPLRGLAIGAAQAVALLPGVSRSGSTIAMSRFLGIKAETAAAFSFLMVVPVILGGNLLHIVRALGQEEASAFEGLTPGLAIVGFVLAAIVGYASVAWMVRLLNRRHFWRFGFYCLTVGLLGLIYFCCV